MSTSNVPEELRDFRESVRACLNKENGEGLDLFALSRALKRGESGRDLGIGRVMALLLGLPCPSCAHRLSSRLRIQNDLIRIGILCTHVLSLSDDADGVFSTKVVKLPHVPQSSDALLCFAICDNCFQGVARRWPSDRADIFNGVSVEH